MRWKHLMTKIDAETFDRVAQKRCKRWKPESLEMIRKHLVDGESINGIAKAHGKQQNTLSTMKARFLMQIKRELALNLDVETFMLNVVPHKDLSPFRAEIKKLKNAGYTVDQISEYLSSNEISVEKDELSLFLKRIEGRNTQ